VRNATLLLAAALLACVAPEPLVPAAVRVEAVRATSPVLDLDQLAPPPIHLLLDVTSSMEAERTEGVTHLRAARHAAERFLHSLPPDADVTLHVLGTGIGSACTPAVTIEGAPDAELARIAGGLPSHSEGSLASALEAIALRIRTDDRGRAGVRVLAISDLDASCAESDLCDAAVALTAAGADLDLVVIGEAPVPDCLGQVGGDGEPPLLAADPNPPLRAAFRVTGEDEQDETPPPVMGVVGGGAVKIAPGRVRIRVDLDPPVEVGPVDLAPGASLRIRLLELSTSGPQRWEVFVDGANVRGDAGSVP
jgi:hypothetical protein